MRFSQYLAAEWKPALGCTEPAAVAYATALAAQQGTGPVQLVTLVCDARTYKNCYAVGIPNSGHRTGILWTLAIGAHLPDPALGLRCFEAITPEVLAAAGAALAMEAVTVTVDPAQTGLYIDCRVRRAQGEGRAVLEREHTRLRRLEADGVLVGGDAATEGTLEPSSLRAEVAALSFAEMIAMAQGMEPQDRALLRQGAAMNAAMGQHGLSLLPPSFVQGAATDPLTRITRLVSAGVLARMSGEPLTVMSLAGSGNKGITVSIPLTLWGREQAHPQERVEEALGLACLVTSATTHHLGTLSAVCGCSNAAGIGIAAALVFLDGGGPGQVDLAVNNMVGNVAGMICDGAKMGCAMKTMTGVDAAFRSATLALAGIGIPASDGIVGVDGVASLAHLGRLAQRGMAEVDKEILAIMQGKLRPAAPELIG